MTGLLSGTNLYSMTSSNSVNIWKENWSSIMTLRFWCCLFNIFLWIWGSEKKKRRERRTYIGRQKWSLNFDQMNFCVLNEMDCNKYDLWNILIFKIRYPWRLPARKRQPDKLVDSSPARVPWLRWRESLSSARSTTARGSTARGWWQRWPGKRPHPNGKNDN